MIVGLLKCYIQTDPLMKRVVKELSLLKRSIEQYGEYLISVKWSTDFRTKCMYDFNSN